MSPYKELFSFSFDWKEAGPSSRRARRRLSSFETKHVISAAAAEFGRLSPLPLRSFFVVNVSIGATISLSLSRRKGEKKVCCWSYACYTSPRRRLFNVARFRTIDEGRRNRATGCPISFTETDPSCRSIRFVHGSVVWRTIPCRHHAVERRPRGKRRRSENVCRMKSQRHGFTVMGADRFRCDGSDRTTDRSSTRRRRN